VKLSDGEKEFVTSKTPEFANSFDGFSGFELENALVFAKMSEGVKMSLAVAGGIGVAGGVVSAIGVAVSRSGWFSSSGGRVLT
jgi:hypothetical protein